MSSHFLIVGDFGTESAIHGNIIVVLTTRPAYMIGCAANDLLLKTGRGQGLLHQLIKKPTARALEVEMKHHLGYAKNLPSSKNTGNSRIGKTAKTVRSVHGEIEREIPCDRNKLYLKKQADRRYPTA